VVGASVTRRATNWHLGYLREAFCRPRLAIAGLAPDTPEGPSCQASAASFPVFMLTISRVCSTPAHAQVLYNFEDQCSVWGHTMDHDDLRRRACRYRDIARTTTDARAVKALNDLADEYEAQAAKTQPDADTEYEDNV
jgi:hypothetical protein